MTLFSEWYNTEAPDVSIVILDHDRSDLTEKCLGAIAAHTRGYTYEIIIVSSDGARVDVGISHNLDINVINFVEYRGLGQGSNIGASRSKGRYLVFLDNGVLVRLDWLQPLIDLLANNPDAGAVGSRILNPDGSVQEIGAFVDEFGNTLQIGPTTAYHPDEELETRIVDFCSNLALALPNRTFRELSGFDLRFCPTYAEVDLCLRIAGTGRFVYYCPISTVVHLKGPVSSMRWYRDERNEIVEVSRVQFLRRWGAWLKQRSDVRAFGDCVLELPKLITP